MPRERGPEKSASGPLSVCHRWRRLVFTCKNDVRPEPRLEARGRLFHVEAVHDNLHRHERVRGSCFVRLPPPPFPTSSRRSSVVPAAHSAEPCLSHGLSALSRSSTPFSIVMKISERADSRALQTTLCT